MRLKEFSDPMENYFFAQASIDLHRAEAEAYAENLQSSDPSIYIVLREGSYGDDIDETSIDDNEIDIHLAEVSLSPYNIQDYEDSGEDIIKKVTSSANSIGGKSVIITFDPHPRHVLQRENKLPILMHIDKKLEIFKSLGLDIALIIPFDKNFS